MFLIGIAGQCQMGKDTIADRLAFKLNEDTIVHWKRTAFASNVKKVFCETFGVDLDFVEKWKTNPEKPPGFDMTVRQALQFIGDGFRKIMAPVWLEAIMRDKTTPIIISDLRYVNEFMRCKTEGGMNVLVGRTEKLNNDPNGSEAEIRPYIQWCLESFPKNIPVVDLRTMDWNDYPDAPENMSAFDVFIRNDGTKEELQDLVDQWLVSKAKNFVFDFTSHKAHQEGNCLLSI
jgi:hypothetical protein